MKTPLRVLIVEDSENDALLVVHELRRSGFDTVFERVDTADAMKTALADLRWQLVVTDYSMPMFSGLSALALVKKSAWTFLSSSFRARSAKRRLWRR